MTWTLREVALRWMKLHEAHRRPDFEQEFERLHAPNFRDFSPGGPNSQRDGFKQGLVAWYLAFPDLDVRVDDLVVDCERSKVAIRWSAVGTHRASYLGAAPTGRVIRFRGIEVITVADAALVERWGEWDGIDLLSQLGLLATANMCQPSDERQAEPRPPSADPALSPQEENDRGIGRANAVEPRRNIEAKYRCPDLAAVRERAQALGARSMGVLKQQDTFFSAPLARLKLRDSGNGKAELISYRRADVPHARGSDYTICRVSDPSQMRQTLGHALGASGAVAKQRELYLFRTTRIHLDAVDNLGDFVELETVLGGQSDDDAHKELRYVAEALGLEAGQVVAKPYVDLLAACQERNITASTSLGSQSKAAPDARAIYQSHPEEYDELIRHEDHDGNLLTAIRAITPLANLDVVEFGAGTGRLTLLLAPRVCSIRAFDIERPMVEVARQHLARLGDDVATWEIGVADNASLPVSDASADLAIAGWTFGHETVWDEGNWKAPIAAAIREMLRVLRPGGTAIVIETLGTGYVTPFDPPAPLARYYSMLADEFQFVRNWVRTDYKFLSMAEGERLIRFFFGDERANLFSAGGSTTLPECTGLWWRKK